MKGTAKLLLIATGLSLAVVQATFVYDVISAGAFEDLTLVEVVVLALAASKCVGFFALKGLREENASGTTNAFTADLFVFEGVALLYLATGDPFYHAVSDQIFQSWLLGTAVFTVPFVIFKAVRSVHRGAPLMLALPGIVLVAEMEQGFLSAVSGRAIALPGALGFGSSLLQLGRAENGFATVQATEPFVYVAYTAFFLSLLLYVALFSNARFRLGASVSLLVLFAGSASTMVWLLVTRGLVTNLSLLLAPPAVLMSALWWWMARAR